MRTLVGFGLQGRDIVMHAVLKWAKVWYPYILGHMESTIETFGALVKDAPLGLCHANHHVFSI